MAHTPGTDSIAPNALLVKPPGNIPRQPDQPVLTRRVGRPSHGTTLPGPAGYIDDVPAGLLLLLLLLAEDADDLSSQQRGHGEIDRQHPLPHRRVHGVDAVEAVHDAGDVEEHVDARAKGALAAVHDGGRAVFVAEVELVEVEAVVGGEMSTP